MAKPVRSFSIHVALTLNFQKNNAQENISLEYVSSVHTRFVFFSLKKSFLKTDDLPTQKQEIKLKADISKKY